MASCLETLDVKHNAYIYLIQIPALTKLMDAKDLSRPSNIYQRKKWEEIFIWVHLRPQAEHEIKKRCAYFNIADALPLLPFFSLSMPISLFLSNPSYIYPFWVCRTFSPVFQCTSVRSGGRSSKKLVSFNKLLSIPGIEKGRILAKDQY